jgi:hypothetical protein
MHDGKPDIRSLEADSYQQSGYFTVEQARRHGVSSQLLNHHVRRGRFERVRRGLYRVRGFPSSQHDELREKWMGVGMDKAVLSHESALSLLELSDNVPDKVHLLVPRRSRGLRRPPGVVIHTHPDDERSAPSGATPCPSRRRRERSWTSPTSSNLNRPQWQPREALRLGLLTRRQLEHEAARQNKTRVLEALLPDR